MGQLAASEAQGDLDLVAFVEELVDGAHLHVIVVRVDVRPHLDFLDVDGLLLLAGLVFLFLLLVFELAVVDDLADRRLGVGRNLDQVEADVGSAQARILRWHDADLGTLFVDQADFGNTDHVVDARAFVDRRNGTDWASYGLASFRLRSSPILCGTGKHRYQRPARSGALSILKTSAIVGSATQRQPTVYRQRLPRQALPAFFRPAGAGKPCFPPLPSGRPRR